MTTMYGLARLGRDVELRSTAAGEPVASLSLAFSYGRKGEDGKRPTQWVEGVLWGKRAEALAQYLTKGLRVIVTLQETHVETYEGKNGTGAKLVGRVAEIELIGDGEQRQAAPPQQRQASAQRPSSRPGSAASYGSAGGFDSMDSDIPFAQPYRGGLWRAV